MDPTVLVALIIIGAIVLVVSILVFITRKQTRDFLAAMRANYRALLLAHQLDPSVEQELPRRILGLDTRRRVFVAYNPAIDDGQVIVPLADVADCRVRNEGAAYAAHINSISLSLRLRDGTALDVPVWSEVLDGLEDKTAMHKAAITWQGRIRAAVRRAAIA